MSSPSGNLKKVKKQPLPQAARSPPYRATQKHGDASKLELKMASTIASREGSTSDLVVSSDDQPLLAEIIGVIREEESKKRKKTIKQSGVPTDNDLVSSMATRLANVEKDLLAAKKEIIEKDVYIRNLEERLLSAKTKLNQMSSSPSLSSSSSSYHDLKLHCEALQQQVDDMEEFLNDYGLVWVGKCQPLTSTPPSLSSTTPPQTKPTLWSPESSLPPPFLSPPSFRIDFNLIASNITSLNTIAGKDCHVISHTPNGAELKVPEPIPLALYSNGLMLFSGPFRPYTDPMTQNFIQDLLDGYFPSELKEAYPEGVPFELNDKRYEEYIHTPHHYRLFPGTGQKLSNSPSSPLTPGIRHTPNVTSDSNVDKGATVSMENFLRKIPKNVIRGGRVIDVHAGLTETLQGSSSKVRLLNTPVVEEIKQRLEYDEEVRPHTPGRLVTLRIKSETGETTYILKMHSSDTIGDIHKQLNKIKSKQEKKGFVLKGAFPPRSFTDMNITLKDSGLVPSANLFLAKMEQASTSVT
ncbi:PREDICTED: UBX domain-containing protein 11-like isoform X2 [Amphimedon queenslandica]|uniref:UBX domain-containing protein 11 n=1 Tax=Amphimedon queenslandica TaxID=400682 RepID=A0AAN0IB17_AMPQE|nr:PREDICTED: UBX domain-containing protein 11-like isoform X2 [Amphimedon queenslandica]|eukprot:XP_003384072.1 PREDICTED: UBX domain-containing protein 11-like isoform X2 [Amphimedon queenslandica]